MYQTWNFSSIEELRLRIFQQGYKDCNYTSSPKPKGPKAPFVPYEVNSTINDKWQFLVPPTYLASVTRSFKFCFWLPVWITNIKRGSIARTQNSLLCQLSPWHPIPVFSQAWCNYFSVPPIGGISVMTLSTDRFFYSVYYLLSADKSTYRIGGRGFVHRVIILHQY